MFERGSKRKEEVSPSNIFTISSLRAVADSRLSAIAQCAGTIGQRRGTNNSYRAVLFIRDSSKRCEIPGEIRLIGPTNAEVIRVEKPPAIPRIEPDVN